MNLSPTQQAKFEEMSMGEKIAILLMQLGEDATAVLFSNMNIDAITDISKYIASNKTVEKSIAIAILEEFYAILQSGPNPEPLRYDQVTGLTGIFSQA